MPMKIGTARAWGRLRDFFDLKGKHDLQLDEIIVPVAVVADLTEADPLADLRAAQGGQVVSPAVGFVGQMQVFNPAGSGVVLEVYLAQFAALAAVNYQLGPVTAALATDAAAQWQDRRLFGLPAARIQNQATLVGPTLVRPFIVRQTSNVTFGINLDVTCPPGTGYMIESASQNVQLYGAFLWRERDEV